jgi:hypothetical protein
MVTTFRERNITAVYRAATDTQREEGAAWYRVARAIAARLDPADPSRGAAVLAVLSPMVQWDRNVRLAEDAYAGRPLGCLSRNADKARRIIAGEDPETVVTGDKVRAFWRAITDPTDQAAIVIDRHALDIAAGEVLGDERRKSALTRKGDYARVAALYRRAAVRLSREYGKDLSPVDVQATTWVAWRVAKKGAES